MSARRAERAWVSHSGGEQAVELDGSLGRYVAYAMAQSPALRADHERWRAAIRRIAPARRLPDPMLSYAFFVRSVETRVGPQRHRLSVQQSIPWPTRLMAGADAAALAAQAAQRRLEAGVLATQREVAVAYYRLWLVRRTHALRLEQDALLEGLSGAMRARVEVGAAPLSDLSQLELRIERHRDHRLAHEEAERAAAARLRAVIGAPVGTDTPTSEDSGGARLPAETVEALREAVQAHPRLSGFELMAEASEAMAERERAAGMPNFTLGMDWIETGEAVMPGVQESGKDPLIVSLSMSVPLWFDSYADAAAAARAEAAAQRADGDAARDAALGALEVAIAEVRDSGRRILLYERTLVPQAEAVYASVLGSYQSGRVQVSEVLLAMNELLELSAELIASMASHEVAWAELEHLAGRAIAAREARDG